MYIFQASYSTLVTSVSKKSSVDQSELEMVVPVCKMDYMSVMFISYFILYEYKVFIAELVFSCSVITVLVKQLSSHLQNRLDRKRINLAANGETCLVR